MVVGGLLPIADETKNGLMSSKVFNSVFTYSGYQSGFFKVSVSSKIGQFAFRIIILGICEFVVYKLSSGEIKAYFLSIKDSEYVPYIQYDSVSESLYLPSSKGMITISTLFSNSSSDNGIKVKVSSVESVPDTANIVLCE